MDKGNLIIIAVIVIVVAGLGGFLWWSNMAPSHLGDFAKCLSEKGVKFYGAFWCSHCQNQKHMFGSAAQYLPYIECSTPDGNGMLKVCTDAGIGGYPTWEFPDGSRQEGEATLNQLAEKSSCSLPQ